MMRDATITKSVAGRYHLLGRVPNIIEMVWRSAVVDDFIWKHSARLAVFFG
jgi:hypothetical protein